MLPGLGIQIPVHAHHPAERDRGVQAPPLVQRIGTLGTSLAFHACPPERHDPLQLGHAVHPGGLDQERLGPLERFRVRASGGHQRSYGRHRDLAGLQGTAGHPHRRQPPCHADLLARGAPGHPVGAHEPRRGRGVSVVGVQAPAVDLGQAPQALGLQLLGRALQLGEVLLDPGVGQLGQRLGL